jgi:hypothetical protein
VLAGSAQAQVHKCTGADGKPVFQSEPCDGSKPVAPAPKSAPQPGPRDLVSIDRELRRTTACASDSRIIEEIIRHGASSRSSQDNSTIDAFRRNCLELGFRYPDSPSSAAHNKAVFQQLTTEYVQQYQRSAQAARAAPTAPAVPADLLAKTGRCADLSRSLENAIRQKATYSGEGAAMIVEFRADCQQLGYKFPDTKANADYNRTRFRELLQESAQSGR